MSNLISQLNLLSPEIFVALMAMLILLLDLFVQDKNKHFIYGLSQLTLLVAGLITASIGFSDPQFAFKNIARLSKINISLKANCGSLKPSDAVINPATRSVNWDKP